MALPGMAPYSSLKRALVGVSLTAREEVRDDNINVSVVYPYITKTNFEKNTIGGDENIMDEENRGDLPPFDTAEFVAEKILEVLKSGEAQLYVHDWMKNQ
jgi:short-subunit dehydrogenase